MKVKNLSLLPLSCPICKKKLSRQNNLFLCENDKIFFEIENNILKDKSVYDEFYENKFIGTHTITTNELKKVSPFNISFRRHFLSLKFLRKFNRILDLGCGGGNLLFREFAHELYGIDLSYTALKQAGKYYDFLFQTSVENLPINEPFFDCIISWDFFGHIPFEKKDLILDKIYSILKKNGLFINVIETDGNNVFLREAKKYPDLYEKTFIKHPGHIGLETPNMVIRRFKRAGFDVIAVKGMWNLFPPPKTFLNYLKPFEDKSAVIKFFVLLNKFFLLFDKVFKKNIANNIAGILNEIDLFFTSVNNVEGIFLVAKK